MSRPREHLGAVRGWTHPRRVLKKDGAQLPVFVQRENRVGEDPPGFIAHLAGDVLGIKSFLRRQLVRQRLAQGSRQALGLRRVAGHPAEGLHVEYEILWRARHPQLRDAPRRQRVVRRIHLDDRKDARVVLESCFGRCRSIRIENTRRDQGRIGPASRAEAHDGAAESSDHRRFVLDAFDARAGARHARIVIAGAARDRWRCRRRHQRLALLRSRNSSTDGGTSRLSAIFAISSA